MSFTHDIFLSYVEIDNVSPFGREKGWVDLLHERLLVLLGQSLGYEPNIWRDGHDLRGNDDLGGAISEEIKRSFLLVPVITPRYVQSAWCRKEMQAFHAAQPQSMEATRALRSRVFKVVKTPLPMHLKEREPVEIRNLVGYQFFAEDHATGLLREFSPDPTDKNYWRMLAQLVAEISRTLIELKHSSVQPSKSASSKLVYLAETTSDLTDGRELVREELRQRGYGVLPEQKLPLQEVKQTEDVVRAALARCALSVHFVGARYGSTPEDDPRSVVRIQEQLAAEHGAINPAFRRLIWMPPDLMTPAMEIKDARQKSLVSELQSRIMEGAELLQIPVRELLTVIRERLDAPTAAVSSGKDSEGPHAPKAHEVFISYSNKDAKLASEVRTALEEVGIGCWMAGDDILPSEIYGRAIIKAINSCRLVLLIFTSNSNSSKHVESEIDRAYNKQKPIILFRIENTTLSESLEYYLSTGSWLDASEPPLDQHLPRLIEKMKRLFRSQGQGA